MTNTTNGSTAYEGAEEDTDKDLNDRAEDDEEEQDNEVYHLTQCGHRQTNLF